MKGISQVGCQSERFDEVTICAAMAEDPEEHGIILPRTWLRTG
jgi:hypothetical protein